MFIRPDAASGSHRLEFEFRLSTGFE